MSGLSTKPNLQKLIADIQECVSDLKRQCNDSGVAINDDCKTLQRFCAKLEYLLQYEQIDHSSFLGGRKDYWNYICDGLASTKGVRDGLKYVKSLSELKTSLGRGRAFLRFALTYQHLADSLQQCVNDQKLTREWYTPASVWLNDDQCRFLISVLYDLNDVRFDLGAKGYDLDNGWPLFARHDLPAHKWNVALSRTSSVGSLNSSYNDSSLKMDPVPFVLGASQLAPPDGSGSCETDGRPRRDTYADMETMAEEDAEAESVEERLTRELDQSELLCSDLAARVGQLEGLLQAADRAKEAATAQLDGADERSGALETRCIELERAVATADEEAAELRQQLATERDALRDECERLREALCVESARRVELEEERLRREEAALLAARQLDNTERRAAELAHALNAADDERRLVEEQRDSTRAELELLTARLADAQATNDRSRTVLRDAVADLLRTERAMDLLPSLCARLADRLADVGFVDAAERDAAESSIGQFVRRLRDEAASLVAAEAAAKAEQVAAEAAAAKELEGAAASDERVRLLQTIGELTGAVRRADAQRTELEQAAAAARRLADEREAGLATAQQLDAERVSELAELRRQAAANREAAAAASATLAEHQKAAAAEREAVAAAALAALVAVQLERDGALAEARTAASEAAAARLDVLAAADSLRRLEAELKDGAERQAASLLRADAEREAALGEAAAASAAALEAALEAAAVAEDARRGAALEAALAAAAVAEEARRGAALDELRAELAARTEEAERRAAVAIAEQAAETEARLRAAEAEADEQRRRADAAAAAAAAASEAERALSAEVAAARAELERAAAAWNDERRDRETALQVLERESEVASRAAAAHLSAALAARDEALTRLEELRRSADEQALEWQRTEESGRRECDAAAERLRRAVEERDAAAAVVQRQLEEAARTADLVAGEAEHALARAAAAEAERDRAMVDRDRSTAELDLVSRDFGELKDMLRSLKQTEAEKSTALARLQVELDRTRAEFERSHATTEQQIAALRFQLSSQQLECEVAIEGYRTQQAEVQQLSSLLTRQEEIIGVLESALQTLSDEKRVEHDLHLRQLQELNREMTTKDEERQANATFFDTVHAELEKERQTRRKLQDELIGVKLAAGEQAAAKENELHRVRDENADLRRKLVKLIRDKDNLWQKTDALVYRQKQRAEVKWMDDSVATHCISCNARFSLTLRKHHCRLCGRIFCHNCSNNWVNTASSSRKARACSTCFADHDPDGSLNSSLLEASVLTANGADDDGSDEDSPAAAVTIAAGGSSGSPPAGTPAEGTGSMLPTATAAATRPTEGGDEDNDESDADEPPRPRLRRDLPVVGSSGGRSNGTTARSSERDASSRASSGSAGSAACRPADGPLSRPQSSASFSTAESDGTAAMTTLECERRVELRAGGGTATVPLAVDEAETMLSWEFTSAPKGIAFGVSYLPSRDASSDSAEVLVPRSKCSSHRGPVSGHLIAHQPGVYVFTFENAGARSPDAIVTYTFRIVSPSQHD